MVYTLKTLGTTLFVGCLLQMNLENPNSDVAIFLVVIFPVASTYCCAFIELAHRHVQRNTVTLVSSPEMHALGLLSALEVSLADHPDLRRKVRRLIRDTARRTHAGDTQTEAALEVSLLLDPDARIAARFKKELQQ